MTNLKEEAEFLRQTIAAGIRPVVDAVTWADAVIAREPVPPSVVIDVALAEQCSAADMVSLLTEVPGHADPIRVARRVLAELLAFLQREPTRGHDVARWLYRMASIGYLPEEAFGSQPFTLEDYFALAADQVYGTYDEAAAALRQYLQEQASRQ